MQTRSAIAFLLTWFLPVAAQDLPVFRANTDVVVVPVTVTDRSGRFVRGLTADQFEVSDGRTRRAVTQFSSDRIPVSLGILLDVSGSMAQDPRARAADDARWADTRRALELLLTWLDAADEVFFAVFNDKLAVGAPWTDDRAGILRSFDSLKPGGGTAVLDAVKSILPVFQLARHQRKVLLLISDGNDTKVAGGGYLPPLPHQIGDQTADVGRSLLTWRETLIAATRGDVRKSGALLYAIGIGTRKGASVDTVLLKGLTTESGGYVEPLRDPSEISAAVARICDDLQSQYLLAFDPWPADGKYHPIRVRTKDPRLKVRSRTGYTASVPRSIASP